MFQCVNSFECKTKCQMKNGVQYYDDDEIEEDFEALLGHFHAGLDRNENDE